MAVSSTVGFKSTQLLNEEHTLVLRTLGILDALEIGEIANSLGDHDLVNDVARRLSGRDLEKLEDFLAANAGQIDPAKSLNTLFEH